jgi:glycosyltransferase involved in cell wall biosynthesis
MMLNMGQVIPVVRRYAYGPIRVPMARAYVREAAPAIASQARDVDVIHAWADGFLALAAVEAAAQLDCPVLITPFAHRHQWGGDRISVAAYRRADRIIGLLADNCELLRELGAPTERVVECPVCSPGVERGGGAAWREEHGVNGPLVLFLAVRRPYKGFDVMLSAIPELARRLPSATVVFAGPGDAIVGTHPLRVIDRGLISDSERATLLEAANVMCLPSAGEIYPSSILEAWSAETPVVTSDIAPLEELMRRSGGGLAVPREPGAVVDAIVKTIEGDGDALGRAGHDYWRRHATVEAVTRKHEELYRAAIADRSGAGEAAHPV